MARPCGDPVADQFGASPVVLPLLPQLFDGIDSLGGWPDRVASLLRHPAGLGAGSTVLDLGCGKGATAIEIARRLGAGVRGVDLFPPFVAAATEAARAAGVAGLCAFEVGDLREIAAGGGSDDAVVYSAIGPEPFGDRVAAVGALRRCVRPGGWIVIVEGFLRVPVSEAERHPGYGSYAGREATVADLTAHGDELAAEVHVPASAVDRWHRRDQARLGENARRVVAASPGARAEVERFVAGQEAEYGFVRSRTVEAIWLLRRSPRD